jgi:Ca2+-binding EF-hand superfamily protein
MVGGNRKPSGTSSQPSTGQNKGTGNDMVGNSTRPDFKSLDTSNNGYLTTKDVKSNKWLSKNFARCDTDHDGQLSRQEYANCH